MGSNKFHNGDWESFVPEYVAMTRDISRILESPHISYLLPILRGRNAAFKEAQREEIEKLERILKKKGIHCINTRNEFSPKLREHENLMFQRDRTHLLPAASFEVQGMIARCLEFQFMSAAGNFVQVPQVQFQPFALGPEA